LLVFRAVKKIPEGNPDLLGKITPETAAFLDVLGLHDGTVQPVPPDIRTVDVNLLRSM
jgi:hypothetical protein